MIRQVVDGGSAYDRCVNVFKVPYNMIFREVLWNSLDAGATKVRIGWDPFYRELFPEAPVFKARCIDNGHGMTPEFMKEYFYTIGKSSKQDGEHFGHGLRLSALVRNPMGLVVVSKVAGGEFHLIHMRLDHETREVYLETFPDPDLDEEDPDNEPDTAVPLSWTPFDYLAHDPIVKEIIGEGEDASGTIILLLGEHEKDSTYLAQSEKANWRLDPAAPMAIWMYLQTRIETLKNANGFTVKDGLDVRVETMHVGKGRLEELRHGHELFRKRPVTGLNAFIPPPPAKGQEPQTIIDQGRMKVPFKELGVDAKGAGAEIAWTVVSEPPLSAAAKKQGKTEATSPKDTTRHQRHPNKGAVGHAYRGELYECAWGESLEERAKFCSFGIDMPLTQQRVYIVVHWTPATFKNGREQTPGVGPSADRLHLEFFAPERDSRQLPKAALTRYFRENMPPTIQNLLSEEMKKVASATASSDDVPLSKVMNQLRKSYDFKPQWVKSKKGSTRGTFQPEEGGADGGSKPDHTDGENENGGGRGGRGGGSKGGKSFQEDKGGSDTARKSTPKAYDVRFVSADMLAQIGVPYEAHAMTAATFKGNTIFVNQDHKLLQTLRSNCAKICPNVEIEDIEKVMRNILRVRMIDRIMMFLGHRRDLGLIRGDGVFSDELLAFGLCGIADLAPDVKAAVQGKKKKKSVAA